MSNDLGSRTRPPCYVYTYGMGSSASNRQVTLKLAVKIILNYIKQEYILSPIILLLWLLIDFNVSCFTMLPIFLLVTDATMRRMTGRLRSNKVKVVESLNVTEDLITELNTTQCISDHQKKRLLTLPSSRRSFKLLDIDAPEKHPRIQDIP